LAWGIGLLLTVKNGDATETKTETGARAAEEVPAVAAWAVIVWRRSWRRLFVSDLQGGGGRCNGYSGESDGDDGFGEHVDNWDSCECVETGGPKLVIAGCARLA
jgi:hypothetical protein